MVKVRASRRQRQLWTAVLAAAATLGAAGSATAAPSLVIVGWFAMMAATVGFAVAEGDPGARGGVMCGLRFDADDVMLSGPGITNTWARSQVVDGYLVPGPEADALVLCMADGRELTLADPTRPPEEVLAELGLDRRAARMSLVADPLAARGCVAFTVAPMAAGIGIVFAAGLGSMLASLWRGPSRALLGAVSWVSVLVFSPLIFGLAHFLVPHRVTIGREGVLVRRFLRRDRFVPYAELQEAVATPAHLGLRVAGERLLLRASDDAAATAARLIEERRRAYEAHVPRAAILAVVRGSEDWARWRDRLGALLTRPQAGFRQGVVDRETLVHMVEDPTGSPELRVGAAYALARGQEAGDARLRIALEGCAEPRLRVALARALDGELEEAALEEAATAVQRPQG